MTTPGGNEMRKILPAAIIPVLLCVSCARLEYHESSLEDQPTQLEELDEGYYDQGEYLIIGELAENQPALCPPLVMDLITDLNTYQAPDLSEPEPRTLFYDPVFGTCLIRATDRVNDPLNPGDSSRGLKNEYARVQSFNADESLLLVRSIESFWYVYDAHSLLPLGEVPAVVEPRWDAHNPGLLYFIDETRLLAYDLSSGSLSLIREFAADFPGQDLAAVWTRYEGSPSYDSRFWGLMAQNSDWNTIAFLIYDLELDQVTIRGLPGGYDIDNVTISPLGNYFLASYDNYCQPGKSGGDPDPCGLMVYDGRLENGRNLLRILGHYDTALDPDGQEVIIYQDIDTDHLSLLDLESGQITPLLPIDFSHTGIGFHFSGRASGLPGWALVSTYNGGHPQAYTWMDDSIFAVELKAGGRVVRIGHTHSLYNENIEKDYWAEPHASVNRDFTKIVFTSNWGRTGTEEVDLYLISLPENWPEQLP
jgi:hypothetical protein